MVWNLRSFQPRSCGLEPTESQVKKLIENVDTNGNGVIEFTEFVSMMVKYGEQKEDDLKDAFKVFDQVGASGIHCKCSCKCSVTGTGVRMDVSRLPKFLLVPVDCSKFEVCKFKVE